MNKELILKKIKDIKLDLDARYHEFDSFAALTGASGALVFYYMLYQLEPTKANKDRFYEIANDIFERINTEDYSKTFCGGLAGVAFTIEFFRQKGWFSNEDVEDALQIFDDIIIEVVEAENTDLSAYDLLHGILGCAYYLNERVVNNKKIETRLINCIEVIAETLQKELNREVSSPKDIPLPNCGLAHGNLSYINIFSRFLKNYPTNEKVKTCLKELVDHQLKFKSADPSTESLFPSIAGYEEDMHYNIVLGWCYGDQVVSIVLYQANEILKEKYIEEEALEIAMHTAQKNTVVLSSKTEVTDAGLCHGVSAVAMNNKILFEITGKQVFQDNYNYFIDAVLKRGNNPSTKSGFLRYFGGEEYEDVVSLLDGTLGVGVFLASTLLEENTSWERFLVLR